MASLDIESRRLKEADLAGHLEGESDGVEDESIGDAAAAPKRSLAEEDFGLYEALNLLKGLDILRPTGT